MEKIVKPLTNFISIFSSFFFIPINMEIFMWKVKSKDSISVNKICISPYVSNRYVYIRYVYYIYIKWKIQILNCWIHIVPHGLLRQRVGKGLVRDLSRVVKRHGNQIINLAPSELWDPANQMSGPVRQRSVNVQFCFNCGLKRTNCRQSYNRCVGVKD